MTNTGSDCTSPACWNTNASASPATPTGRLALFRAAVAAAAAALTLDAHGGENQDGCRALMGSAVHGDPETPGRRIRREFDDGRHFKSHCRNVAIRAWRNYNQDMVNGILIRSEQPARAGYLSRRCKRDPRGILVNDPASSQFIFLNALLKRAL
jgi:hypothetical protein